MSRSKPAMEMSTYVSQDKIPEPVYENGVWKGATVNWPEGYFKLGERLLTQLKKNPDFVGQIDAQTGKKDTYKCMGERSIRCAIWLKKQGVKRGDVMGLCGINHLDCATPLYASLYLGAIFNPWYNQFFLDEDNLKLNFVNNIQQYIENKFHVGFNVIFTKKLNCHSRTIQTTQPKVLFVDEDFAEIIVKTVKKLGYPLIVVVFGEKNDSISFKDILEPQSADEVDKFECTEIEAQDPAVIMYTSGTTSFSKGAVHSYHSVANMMNYYSDDSKPSTVLWFSYLSWISGLRTVLRSIIFKATMIVWRNPNEDEACKLIEKYKVTRLTMAIHVINRLRKSKEIWKYDVSSIEQVAFGGGVITKEHVEFTRRLFRNADIYLRYGGTEFGTLITGKRNPNKLNSCGKIFFNAEVKVVDLETKETLGPNEEGELWCRTTKLMSCYWNSPTETKKVIDSEDWFHTGDLGYYDNDGDFFVIDRINEVIRSPLRRIPSALIENVVQGLPGVEEAAVVAVPSLEYYESSMIFVTKAHGMQITESEIYEAVERKLNFGRDIVQSVCFLEKMPRTTSRKIAKRELRAIARAMLENESIIK